ncbi:YihY/virulence factor BrkB family protein [Variovorax dokdonensis]|uniref:YihY/virulence factor BrkB family protein n=1 Tax=Variovorax dokdonensis TaxID=344883 RepID=A0ABT7N9V7_9BURK|nr:YihY/virulence factor BrkB family protein [Variovorax dokdonensis]MDM0044726.1 YihY/virulence factor BrkB family protein [Variovorax dokdonensis]
MTPKTAFELCRKSVNAWIDDFAPSMGAAIAYYTMFSLAPLLVIVIAVAGAVFGREAVQGEIAEQLTGLIGRDGALAVQGLVRSASEPDRGLIAGIISGVVLLVGATTVFAELQSALDRIWHVPERDKPSGVWAVLRARVLSFGLILALAFLLMVSLVVSAVVAAFGTWAGALMPGATVLLQALNLAISVGMTTVLFAMIYKFMPTTPIGWRDVWVGAGVTAVLFEVGKTLISLYLGMSSVTESYAAAGSLVVVLAWVYYAAQVFLLGAEFTKVHADANGSRSGKKAMVATDVQAAEAKEGTDRVDGPGVLPVAVARSAASSAITHDVDAPATDDAKLADKAQRDVDRRVAREVNRLTHQVVMLAALAVANFALQRWTRNASRTRSERRKALKNLHAANAADGRGR